MKRIGLTGGIGSGKSTVAAVFRTLGIPVYDSDARAKELMHTDPALRDQIIGLLGNEAYTSSGEVNRSWIAAQVFSDPDKLAQLNSLVHPAVGRDIEKWVNESEQRDAPYVIKESALLFEENLTRLLDAVILVVAPESIRIERVMKRDGVTEQQVRSRMYHQWADERKIPLADYIIYNDGQRSLLDQVMDIDRMIRYEG